MSFYSSLAQEFVRLKRKETTAGLVRDTLVQQAGASRLTNMDTCALLSTTAEVFNVEVHVWALVGGSTLEDGGRLLPCTINEPRSSSRKGRMKVNLIQHGVPAEMWSVYASVFTIE